MSAILEERDGLRIVHVFGGPRARGLQHGQALRDDICACFREVWEDGWFRASPLFPRWLFRAWARMQARHLDAEEMDELRGVAQGCGLDLDDVLIMNSAPPFEAAHNLLSGGQTTACTQIAVRGPHGMLLGRNLDTVGLERLHRHFVVQVQHPDDGPAWVTPGFAGKVLDAVTGWNAHGLVVSQDTSELPFEHLRGVYTGALVRRLVARCASVAAAERLLLDTPALCGGGRNVLVADRASAAVLEIAQPLLGLPRVSRRGFGECGDPHDALLVTNHFRTPELDVRSPSVSSAARRRRAAALVAAGVADAAAMKMAMTDKLDPRNGRACGPGRPSDCIVNWYGRRLTHFGPTSLPADLEVRVATLVSTVCDLGAGVMWVGGGQPYVCESEHYRPLDVSKTLTR